MGKSSDKEKSGLFRELIIWITLLVSIILILCIFNLCGPLSGIFGSLLFGLFGFMAYIFPFLLFFSIGFYLMNRNNKKVTSRVICTWVLYVIICALCQLFKSEQAESVFICYVQGYKEKSGGGFIGGLLSMGLDAVMGTFAAAVLLIIVAIMLIVFITGKLIASGIIDRSSEKYSRYKEEHKTKEKNKPEQNEVTYNKRRRYDPDDNVYEDKPKKKYRYTFPKNDEDKKDFKEVVDEPKEEEIKDDDNVSEQTVTVHWGDNRQEIPIYQQEINEKFGHEEVFHEKSDDNSLEKLVRRAYEPDNAAVSSAAVNITEVKPDIDNTKQKPDEVKAVSDIGNNETSNDSGELDIKLPPEPIKYVFPSIELLSKPKKGKRGMSERELQETARRLKDCLKSFKVDVTLTDIICGPTVTRYELMPALGTRVKKITELENDIKLNLAASDIRIEAPIPGKSAVGIEVPNSDDSLITLREILESSEFINHKSNIAFAAGKDIGGRNIVADIAKMPHLLIAGSTGSGKSVCINTIVMSIIYKADPNDVKLIMVDPKVVELSVYNGIPHLCIPVVTDPKKAAAALNWAVAEMNDRYSKFAEFGVRDMAGFNKKIEKLKDNPNNYVKMPQIVIIVDELADLMMVASHDVETAICRLAQMARAAGLHLIIATQRPSVDVITGLIKANVPSRIAFAVSSSIDSRTILDSSGAEKLLGKGDMLFYPQDISKPIRVQGAFVSDSEVAKVTDFVKSQYDEPVYNENIKNQIENTELTGKTSDSRQAETAQEEGNGRDELFGEAGRFIIEKQKASIGTLQRVFKIGFNRGARIMDQLCEAGVVSEEDGKKPRNILMTLEEFEQMLAEGR